MMDPITFAFILILVFILTANLFAIYWFGSMLIPLVKGGAPYVPTPKERLKQMIELAKITPNDTVVDLGSGDGRLVIAAAEAGAKKSIGYEVHPGLVKHSRRKIARAKLSERAEILKQSFWKADLSDVDVVLLYQIPYSMPKLEELLNSQLKKGARIISNAFNFPGWQEIEKVGHIYVYKK